MDKSQILTGGIQFVLEHGGDRTCAISYQGELVLIGGFGVNAMHGKVDRYRSKRDMCFENLFV